MKEKEERPRVLLARLRSGNYAHPGDVEAIDIFMAHLERLQQKPPLHILDVGCGRGGTADYIKKKSVEKTAITGIDIDKEAITVANSSYENINFKACDIQNLDQNIDQLTSQTGQKFDLMYMFSVFYALPEALQKESLYQLASIAQDGAMLAICDYVRLDEDLEEFYDFAGKPMKPPLLGDLKKWLDEAGWALVEDVNLSDKYIQWYREFLEKLSNQKEALLIDFTEKTVHQVTTIFQAILNKVETKVWGGSILYARKRMFFSREPEDASVAGLNESEDCHFKSGCR